MAPRNVMPLFTDAYHADTKRLRLEEHGAYLLLLMEMWRCGGYLPNDPKVLARILGCHGSQFKSIWRTLGPFFTVVEGENGASILTQKKLCTLLSWKSDMSALQKQKADKRWLKEKLAEKTAKLLITHEPDDAAALPNGMPNACRTDAEQMPESMPESMPNACRSDASLPNLLLTESPHPLTRHADAGTKLRMAIVDAFRDLGNNPNGGLPDTGRAETWITQGYDPAICIAVVREVLERNPTISTLAYFDKPIARAHESRAPAPKPNGNGSTKKPDVEYILRHWLSFGETQARRFLRIGQGDCLWPEDWGEPPGSIKGCIVPDDMLRKAGIEPRAYRVSKHWLELRRVDRTMSDEHVILWLNEHVEIDPKSGYPIIRYDDRGRPFV